MVSKHITGYICKKEVGSVGANTVVIDVRYATSARFIELYMSDRLGGKAITRNLSYGADRYQQASARTRAGNRARSGG